MSLPLEKNQEDSCLSCRLISGTALLAAGTYVGSHGKKISQPHHHQRLVMFGISAGNLIDEYEGGFVITCLPGLGACG